MGPGGVMCFLGGGACLVALLIGSVILRAAVSLANRSVGPVKAKADDPFADWDWDDEPEDEPPRSRGKALPEPGIGKGMMITSTVGVLTVLIVVVVRMLTEDLIGDLFRGDADLVGPFALVVLTAPFSFVGMALLLTAMLPTTFWRAGLVAFFYHLFAVLLLAVAVGTVVVTLRL